MPPPVREVTLSGLRRASGITADDMERRVIAIVVPYRDRASHLAEFLSYMTRVLGMNSRIRSEQCESIQERSSSSISGFDGSSGKSSIEFEIIIVEQDNALPFNRGWLMNVGYHLATSNRFIGGEGKSWSPADIVIFHDIDILPSGEMVMFYATPPPVHNALHMINPMWSKGPRLMFSYYGGINSFRSEDFLSINGFPNDLFGWGLEDDCLRQRAALRTPYPLETLRPLHGQFSFLPHTSNRNDSTLTSYVDVLRKDAKTEDGLVFVPHDLAVLFQNRVIDVTGPYATSVETFIGGTYRVPPINVSTDVFSLVLKTKNHLAVAEVPVRFATSNARSIMAGAGQPFYMPLTWPIGNVLTVASMKGEEKAKKPVASPDLDVIGHLTSAAAASRSFALALVCIYVAYPDETYPAFGDASVLKVEWMLPILLRNLLATWIICGFWDWFLYFSPLKEKLRPFKINPRYPSFDQIKHDAFWTTTASICAGIIEIILCHGWARGALSMRRDFMNTSTFLWAITITHWRIPHFWLIHRSMHPWKISGFPDVGKFLYRHVHSIHHKSYNPTAFSGTNMHPVESTLYYSAALIPVYFGAHPAVAIGCIVDCAVGAWLGHDGFQFPGSGDYFHQLHHAHFDCNYGAMHVPIDKWLGTYAGRKEDVRKIWGKRPSGASANPTPVHK
eukprot:g1967.t1